jgi:cytochrome c553
MKTQLSPCLSLFVLFFFGTCAYAGSEDANIKTLMELVNNKTQNLTVKTGAIQAGQERALLCSYCHGPDGNSIQPDIPNLAGQNAVYLLDQINKFSDKRRINYVMNSLAKNLSQDDKVNLAIFFASQSVKPVSADKQLAAQGKQVYKKVCSNCHGSDGLGDVHFPRLAGQRSDYVKLTLMRFKENTNAFKKVKEEANQRRNSVMESIVKNMSEQEIETVAAYVSTL